MRVIVTGSRDWPYRSVVYAELMLAYDKCIGLFTVVHGANPNGADRFAADWVDCFGSNEVAHEPHPANWAKLGNAAGPSRNEDMALLGADLCLAFRLNKSRGTTDMIKRCGAHNIPVRLIDVVITGP